MKKLINDVQDVLDEQLAGLAKAHPSLTLHQDPVYVTRADAPVAGKVALLSGGGSGHEPMHCGYIGQGMLSGACPGEIFNTESEYLTGLDREIGDADHGLNMNRGFSKVVEKLPAIADKDIGFILKNTGMTLLSCVGGASGPLFGTFFIRAAQATQARQSLTLEELYQMFRDGADGVISRGKAEPGDKTMCDVWVPVVESLRQSSEQNLSVPAALEAASSIAEFAAQSTITMQARKGRASYLGERSIGHQDPGATSVMFMMQMLALAAKE